jgi:hypothetical protein
VRRRRKKGVEAVIYSHILIHRRLNSELFLSSDFEDALYRGNMFQQLRESEKEWNTNIIQ